MIHMAQVIRCPLSVDNIECVGVVRNAASARSDQTVAKRMATPLIVHLYSIWVTTEKDCSVSVICWSIREGCNCCIFWYRSAVTHHMDASFPRSSGCPYGRTKIEYGCNTLASSSVTTWISWRMIWASSECVLHLVSIADRTSWRGGALRRLSVIKINAGDPSSRAVFNAEEIICDATKNASLFLSFIFVAWTSVCLTDYGTTCSAADIDAICAKAKAGAISRIASSDISLNSRNT
jgi:hypothetical protein